MHTFIIFLASLFDEKSYSVMVKIASFSPRFRFFLQFNFFFFTNDEKIFVVFRQLPGEKGT
jgi:hypothetical protein